MAEDLVRPRGALLTLRRGLMLLALVLAALVVAEVVLRALDASRGYSTHARTAWYWLFQQDPFLGYRGRPGASASIAPSALPGNADSIQHGPEGFRDQRSFRELEQRGARRLVVCVGDGNTYGLNAGGNHLTYPAALEQELARRSGGEDWIVFNAGLPGYTTHENLELIKLRLLQLRPDIVLSMSLASDFEQVTQYLDGQLDYDFYPLRMAALSATPLNDALMRSVLLGRFAQRWRSRFLDDQGGRWPMTAYGEPTERGLKLYLDNIALTAALCARSGVAFMLVDQPMHYSACSYGPPKIASVERVRGEVERAAHAMGVPVLAAHAQFDWQGVDARGDLLLSSNETALGRLGYQRLAEVLAPQVLAAYAAWSTRSAQKNPVDEAGRSRVLGALRP